MMDNGLADQVERVKAAVATFFKVYSGTSIGLILPDGWFGKPYDNMYELRAINSSDNGLVEIDLGWGWKVSYVPESTSVSDDLLELHLAGSEIAVSSIASSKRYDRGTLRFVVSDKSSFAKSVVEQARIELPASLRSSS